MKRENIITITDNGEVNIPATVSMRDFEIAQLFEVFQQNIKTNIRAILKSGVSHGDISKGGVVVGNSVIPEYFGLDMVIAIAFRIQSNNAEIFRKHVMEKLTATNTNRPQPIFIQLSNEQIMN